MARHVARQAGQRVNGSLPDGPWRSAAGSSTGLWKRPPTSRYPRVADLIPARPGWMARAACRGMAPGIFFPSRGEATDEAREVCAGCPVGEPCLAYAVAGDLEGVWAGTWKRERRGMRRRAS